MYPEDFFLKTSYVSLIYKCRIVLKIFTDSFLSYTLPQRGEISNISNRQTKYVVVAQILLEVDGLPNRLLHISSVVVDAELQHLRVGELEGLQHPVELQGND